VGDARKATQAGFHIGGGRAQNVWHGRDFDQQGDNPAGFVGVASPPHARKPRLVDRAAARGIELRGDLAMPETLFEVGDTAPVSPCSMRRPSRPATSISSASTSPSSANDAISVMWIVAIRRRFQ
jgi:hypothetical protein